MEVAMLERFFLRPQTVDRIMGCWLGTQIERYVTVLCEQGYSARTIFRRIPILVEFADFTEARGAGQIELAADLVEEFVTDWVSARRSDHPANARRRDRNLARGTVRQFFSLAVSQSEYRPARAAARDPFATQVPGFFKYLREERGLRQSSIRHYQHYLRRLERYLDEVGCSELGELALPVVTGFVTTTAQEFGSRSMVCLCSVLRVFLRYAHREGILPRDLSKLVEVPQHYRLADIPRSIGWDAVQKMLDQVDRRTVGGRRDYAMLLLMITYGLRAREVSVLTLDDIDWKRDRLHVRERKADHTTTYPLSPVVGEAIVDYLKNGRPHVQSRVLFWRHLAPRAPLTHAAVSSVASKYLHRAGIPVARPGSHTLRHACVQRLVDRGFPLKTVGDYVGHRSPSSTMIYAKVQVDALREVALGDGEELQ
jgi:integrase/recombinase XerD